jgi:hypothetical protein
MISAIVVIAILVLAALAFRKGFGKHGVKCDICSCGGCKNCHKFDGLKEPGEES